MSAFPLPPEGSPSTRVLETTRPVVVAARSVSLDLARLRELCRGWAEKPFAVPGWDHQVHWSGSPEATCNYILLLDALNFCFWPDEGQPRWTVRFEGQSYDGYGALAVSLKRAVQEGVPLTSAQHLSSLDEAAIRHIFRGDGEIPLVPQRLANAREVGQVLASRFGGELSRAIESCQGSAVALVDLLVEHFSSFRDLASYGGQEVRILKRAQITVVDIAGSLSESGLGKFNDIAHLTAFADYKIPQILRALGVMVYASELAERVDQRRLLDPGSAEEVEIRATMVWAVELIRQELERLGRSYRAFELDWFLWYLSQSPDISRQPYHRTRTIFY